MREAGLRGSSACKKSENMLSCGLQGEDTHHKKRTAPGMIPITKKQYWRGDIISKQIKVVDLQDRALEPTYIKRAHQLVKKGRAEWISEDSIRLLRHSKEGISLEPVADNIPSADGAAAGQIATAEAPAYDDGVIRDLAIRRMAAKRNLVGQAFDFLLIVFAAILFVWSWNSADRSIIAFILCAFWGIRLLYRVFKFAKPSFKDGFREYLRKRKEQKLEHRAQKLELECDRIKKMGAEYVAGELRGK